MPVSVQRGESTWLIKISGQATLASASELKQSLQDGLAAGRDLELDLDGVEAVDVPTLQIVYAAACQAARSGTRLTGRSSSAAAVAMRGSGFPQLPGFPFSGAVDE